MSQQASRIPEHGCLPGQTPRAHRTSGRGRGYARGRTKSQCSVQQEAWVGNSPQRLYDVKLNDVQGQYADYVQIESQDVDGKLL